MTETSIDLKAPLILGFGVTSQAVAKALLDRGFSPTIVEDFPSEVKTAAAAKLGVSLVESPTQEELAKYVASASCVLPSPGVPDHHAIFALAAEYAKPIFSEFDLASLWDSRPIVIVTGTNGKTSVTTLVAQALVASGIQTDAVGNADVPLVEAIENADYDLFVVEASSFRLAHSASYTSKVAAWLNFAPDHLDAHASLEAYREAKASIFERLSEDATVIVNLDDHITVDAAPSGVSMVSFSSLGKAATWTIRDGSLLGPDGPLLTIAELQRTQPHDLANAVAVAAIASEAGATNEAIKEVLVSFVGFAHRVELVGSWDNIAWYNDSKASVPQAALAAIGGFDSIVLLAGGKNKGLDLSSLATAIPQLRAVIAMGDAADEVAAVFEGKVPLQRADSMEEAIEKASTVAQSGDTVLLSPACTSFDWYSGYGARGDHFRSLVQEMIGQE